MSSKNGYAQIGTNVQFQIENGVLTIQCDLTPASVKAARASKSGLTKILASTHGAQTVEQTSRCKLSLNLMLPQQE